MKVQIVATADPAGRRVAFVVEPTEKGVKLDQVVNGRSEGYRGRFTPQEAADLGAALLMASGSLRHSQS